MAKHSFLPNSTAVLRTMIEGVLESYENPWDLFAELAQNSMDAIRLEKPNKGNISVRIDQKRFRIQWKDNGCGIDPADIDELFVLYGTNKRGNPKMIGEKGVGIKFVIFSSSRFELTSHHEEGSFKLSVDGACDWLSGENDADIEFYTTKIDNPEGNLGVEIDLIVADKDDAVFDLNILQLENLLRTRTAVGSTKHVWESEEEERCDIDISIRYRSGKIETSNAECSFLLPIKDAKKSLSLEAYREWAADGTKSDDQKRKKLKNALLYNSGSKMQSGREIKFWSCMAPTRKHWAQFAVEKQLIDPTEQDDADSEYHFYVQFGEVFLSTKYMPTGVTIELRPPGEAGYTENFFIIIEDESLSFDIGRKGIAPRTAGILRQIAQAEFREYLKFKRFLRGEATTTNSQFERDKLFEEIRALPDLKCSASQFIKRPNGQEATVAALFYEQLGKGQFEGFKPYVSGYRDRYDLTGRYNDRNLVIEFKFTLTGLFADFSLARKMFDELNVLIVWEITEEDRKKASDKGIEIDDVDPADEDRIFPRSDTILSIDSVAPIEVVQMKKLLGC